MFRLGIFLLLFSFLVFTGWYYSILLKRCLGLFKIKNLKKIWIFSSTFFCYFLAFCTVNIFSSLGIFLFHFFIFSLIMEFIHFLVSKVFTNHIEQFIYKSSMLPIIITFLFFFYGFFNIRNIVKTEYTIYTQKNISDFRILFLSDAHYGTILKKEGIEKIRDEVNDLDVDFVFLGGDIVDENTTNAEMREVFSVLGSISNTKGIYFVYGNHDRQNYARDKNFTVEELDNVLKENHILSLCDEVFYIDDLVIVGREDLGKTRMSSEELLSSISNSTFVILLDHQPVDYEFNNSLGVDLMLSGHTHAGQIFPAGHFIQWFHMADLWYGHLQMNFMDAIVSSGVSGWGYPVRTQNHSEYVIIQVMQKKE